MARSGFGERLESIFHHDSNQKIADKIGVSAPAVQNYRGGRVPPYDTLLKIQEVTNCDLHWLLTGETRTRPRSEHDTGMEQIIRKIVREEMAAAEPVQDLGEIDTFDLEAEIENVDNPIEVMRRWYDHDGIQVPELTALQFSGWSGMSTESKAEQLRAMRGIIKRQEERRRNAPKPTRDTE